VTIELLLLEAGRAAPASPTAQLVELVKRLGATLEEVAYERDLARRALARLSHAPGNSAHRALDVLGGLPDWTLTVEPGRVVVEAGDGIGVGYPIQTEEGPDWRPALVEAVSALMAYTAKPKP
jgi:hypothetical protein